MNLPYAEVIGDPIAHSKSPIIHTFWLSKLGKAGDYRASHVRPEELATFLADRRSDESWAGCNVTIPHKIAIMDHLDHIQRVAATVGAVNTVTMDANGALIGRNTDVEGFLEPLAGLVDDETEIHVIGAGGAARAVAASFQGRKLIFFNRDLAKAERLAAEFSAIPGAEPLAALARPEQDRGRCLIVNASALGMVGQNKLAIELDAYAADSIVYDLVYAPLDTELLLGARRRGMRAIDGLHMLVGQAARAFHAFFGVAAPREHDAALRRLLTS